MKKDFKRKSLLVSSQDEPGVADLINKLQQQLNAMEKKLDILISQPSKRPFEKSYSQKPSGQVNYSHRHDRGRQSNGPREKTYTRVICADCKKECEIPFKPSDDRPVYCKECFPKHKKGSLFNSSRNNRPGERKFSRERHSVKKKKPFFARGKKRA